MAVGSANITATIDDISASVPVTVYEVQSNSEETDVPDTAGDIIDDIGNNDNPDITNTDIDPSEIDTIHDQIHEGIDRGDEFRSDIMLSKRDWAHFKKYWDEIQRWISNGEFVGGFDINVEIYHQDGQGNKYHIANITQFENEIGFTIDSEAFAENAPGQLKDLRMIRIHDGKLEMIPVTLNKNGSISAKSDKFSEFVLMSVPVQESTFTLPGELLIIESEAFAGSGAYTVVIPESVTTIRSRAFAEMPNLGELYFEGSTVNIEYDALGDRTDVKVVCQEGSSAAEWANQTGLPVEYY